MQIFLSATDDPGLFEVIADQYFYVSDMKRFTFVGVYL